MVTPAPATLTIPSSEVVTNSLNTSTSKMQYSFSKTKRFPTSLRAFKDVPFYDVPSTREARTATFGVGSKTTFEDRRVIPASNSYTLYSEFKENPKKGFSFGVGRQKTKSTLFRVSHVPGPGTYNPEERNHPISAMMLGKVKDHSLDEKIKVPGPGQYDQPLLTKGGRPIESKHLNSRLPVILKSVRSKTDISDTPGPWAYNAQCMTPKSQKPSTRAPRFGIQKKLAIYKINDTPGPGNRFSEFPS